mgnify:CR=1 FL=1
MENSALSLITLNIWGGHLEAPLFDFFSSKKDVDIFCLQEVYCKAPRIITNEERYINRDVFSDIQSFLPEHQGFFRPIVKGIYGIGMFIKKGIEVLDEGGVLIHENKDYPGIGPTHSRSMQYAKCSLGMRAFTLFNVHGLWNGKGKTDTPERIEQSKKIKAFVDATMGPKILCGDFNLTPEAESLRLLAEGMHDHVKFSGVGSTRTSYYPGSERFADYIFSTPDVETKSFEVLEDEVSDHAPLFFEFSMN